MWVTPVDQWLNSYASEPDEIVLDFDATDDPVHGQQEGRFFHGYYDGYCFLPLYMFCGDQPLFAWLRPSNIDGARGVWATLQVAGQEAPRGMAESEDRAAC